MREAIAGVLVGLAAAMGILGALGVLVARDPWDRLHYTSPPAFAAVLVAAAIAVRLGPAIATEKAVLLALVVVVTSPVTVQALARATATAVPAPPVTAGGESSESESASET